MKIAFSRMVTGDVFWYAGALYIKQSTRTAKLCAIDKTFYFGKNDQCKVALDSRYKLTKYHDRYELHFCEEYIFSINGSWHDAIRKAVDYEANRMKSYRN